MKNTRLEMSKRLLEQVYPEGGFTLIERSATNAKAAGVRFKALAPGIELDDSMPYSYMVINLKRGKFYFGISWATGEGSSRDGVTHQDDTYTGSPSERNSYRRMLEKQAPHDFLMVVYAQDKTPEGYGGWSTKERNKWLESTLGEGERYAIKKARELLGQHWEGGAVLNVGDGGVGVCGSDAKPVIDLMNPETLANPWSSNAEMAQGLGVFRANISEKCLANAALIRDGNRLKASPPRRGITPLTGTALMYLEDFQQLLGEGYSVEIEQGHMANTCKSCGTPIVRGETQFKRAMYCQTCYNPVLNRAREREWYANRTPEQVERNICNG